MLVIGLSEVDEVLRYAVVVIICADVDVVVVSAFAADEVVLAYVLLPFAVLVLAYLVVMLCDSVDGALVVVLLAGTVVGTGVPVLATFVDKDARLEEVVLGIDVVVVGGDAVLV